MVSPARPAAHPPLTRLEICEDVRDECSKFGMILDIKVPRPVGGSRQSAGVGKIFVKYDGVESATKALQALAGRKFADRTVVTTYFPEAGPLCSSVRPGATSNRVRRRTSTSARGRALREHGRGRTAARQRKGTDGGADRGRGVTVVLAVPVV